MRRKIFIIVLLSGIVPQTYSQNVFTEKLANKIFQLTVTNHAGNIYVKINDIRQKIVWADGIYQYDLTEIIAGRPVAFSGLKLSKIVCLPDRIRISGLLGDFEIEQELILGCNSPFLAEEMKVVNRTGERKTVTHFRTSFGKRIVRRDEKILNDYSRDHFQAVPFLRRSDDAPSFKAHDYTIKQIIEGKGFVFQTSELTWNTLKRKPSTSFISEGWGWRHGSSGLGVFSFNQDNMIFSTISYDKNGYLRFGGFAEEGLNLSALKRFEPGTTIFLGLNRLYPIAGGYNEVAYTYRGMLDELGCRFPNSFNPPVHWEEHFSRNMKDGWIRRKEIFTLANIVSNEVKKAKAYSCQALYLDPGWDTMFGSLIWDSSRLGSCKDFVGRLKKKFGLQLSLHTPLSPWTTNEQLVSALPSTETWPASARRIVEVMDTVSKGRLSGEKMGPSTTGPRICLGSRQYLDEATKRLLRLCKAGVTFLMFDGTYWNGPCEDTAHGHPVPFLYEDQMDACVELARRIHLKYPHVLIEMHDMLNGGHWTRATPVYYKYGLPGSYDENWGFELMWKPLAYLKDRQAVALYYYNLGCNVPLYLHVDLGQDNDNSLVFWWYASTARHLGIGCSNDDPKLAKKHYQDMKLYRQLEDFFQHGDFYGINKDIHIHTLPEKHSCVINVFNLSDSMAVKQGIVSLKEAGLDPNGKYRSNKDWITIRNGEIIVNRKMRSWDAALAIVKRSVN